MGAPCLTFYLNTLPNLPFGPKQSSTRRYSNMTFLFRMSVLSSIINPRTRDVRACPLIHSRKTAAIAIMISVAAMWLTYLQHRQPFTREPVHEHEHAHHPVILAGLLLFERLVDDAGLLDLRVVLGLVLIVRTDLEGTAAGMAGIAPECIVRVLAVPTNFTHDFGALAAANAWMTGSNWSDTHLPSVFSRDSLRTQCRQGNCLPMASLDA